LAAETGMEIGPSVPEMSSKSSKTGSVDETSQISGP